MNRYFIQAHPNLCSIHFYRFNLNESRIYHKIQWKNNLKDILDEQTLLILLMYDTKSFIYIEIAEDIYNKINIVENSVGDWHYRYLYKECFNNSIKFNQVQIND